MKTIAVLLLVVAGIFGQGAPAALSAAPATWELVSQITLASDTLKPADSLVLVTQRGFQSGYQYVLSRGAIVRASTSDSLLNDSLQYILYFDRYNASGSAVVERAKFDTLGAGATIGTSATNGEQYVLPVGITQIGAQGLVKAVAGAANKTAAASKKRILYLELWRRKLSK